MKIEASGHIIIVGDFNPSDTIQIIAEIVYDRRNDGQEPQIVCCFRGNDNNPLDKFKDELRGAIVRYSQVGDSGFTQKVFTDVSAREAEHIYVMCNNDITAIGVIGALSRLRTKARVALILREQSSAELVPETNLLLRLIPPMQAKIAVREMEDPGTGAALAELSDVQSGETIFTLKIPFPPHTSVGHETSFGKIRKIFEEIFGSRAILIGFSDPGGKPNIRPREEARVLEGARLLYISDRDLTAEDEGTFRKASLKIF